MIMVNFDITNMVIKKYFINYNFQYSFHLNINLYQLFDLVLNWFIQEVSSISIFC